MKLVRAIVIVLIAGIPLGAYVPQRILTPAGLALERWADGSFPADVKYTEQEQIMAAGDGFGKSANPRKTGLDYRRNLGLSGAHRA